MAGSDTECCRWRPVDTCLHFHSGRHIYLGRDRHHMSHISTCEYSERIFFGHGSEGHSRYWHWSPRKSTGHWHLGWLPWLTEQLPPFWQYSWQVCRLHMGPVKPGTQRQAGEPRRKSQGTGSASRWVLGGRRNWGGGAGGHYLWQRPCKCPHSDNGLGTDPPRTSHRGRWADSGTWAACGH